MERPRQAPGWEPWAAQAELFQVARQLYEAGQAFALVTVVDRLGPVSAQVGDKALVTADGRILGWVGGSCSRSVVLREAEAAVRSGRPRLVRVGAGPSPAATMRGLGGAEYVAAPMACASGGELLLYVEPHRPAPGLAIFGATPIARALCRLGQEAGFRVLWVVSRDEMADGSGATGPLLEELTPQRLEGFLAAVAASHGLYDEESLEHARVAGVGYLGLVASRRRAEAVRAYLAGRGWSDQELARIRSPAGLDLGGVTAGEVAISILAEIVAFRHRREAKAAKPADQQTQGSDVTASGGAAAGARGTGGAAADARGTGGAVLGARAPGEAGADAPAPGGALGGPMAPGGVGADAMAPAGAVIDVTAASPTEGFTATDPVCGMAVAVATARYTAVYGGRTFYFCCPSCRRIFLERPEVYAGVPG